MKTRLILILSGLLILTLIFLGWRWWQAQQVPLYAPYDDVPSYVNSLPSADNSGCVRVGCRQQYCLTPQQAAQEIMRACDDRPEYACYHLALCERQSDGGCGFASTPEYVACLAEIDGDSESAETR